MVGIELKKIRIEQNITRAELSKRTGISCNSILNYEDGRHTQFDVLEKMAAALGYEIDLIKIL